MLPYQKLEFIKITKPYILKNDTQLGKLHGKLIFPNIFRLTAIYTWAPAFKVKCF